MTSGNQQPREPSQEHSQREADGLWMLEELGAHELIGKLIRTPDGRVLPIEQWTLIYEDEIKYRERVEPFILRYKEIHSTKMPDDPERLRFEEGLRGWVRYYYDKYKLDSEED